MYAYCERQFGGWFALRKVHGDVLASQSRDTPRRDAGRQGVRLEVPPQRRSLEKHLRRREPLRRDDADVSRVQRSGAGDGPAHVRGDGSEDARAVEPALPVERRGWLPVWGEDYYSNMVLWAVPMALRGESIAQFARGGLLPAMLRAARKEAA